MPSSAGNLRCYDITPKPKHRLQRTWMWGWDGLGTLVPFMWPSDALWNVEFYPDPMCVQIHFSQFEFFSIQWLKVGQRGRFTCLLVLSIFGYIETVNMCIDDPVGRTLFVCLFACLLATCHSPYFIFFLFCDFVIPLCVSFSAFFAPVVLLLLQFLWLQFLQTYKP